MRAVRRTHSYFETIDGFRWQPTRSACRAHDGEIPEVGVKTATTTIKAARVLDCPSPKRYVTSTKSDSRPVPAVTALR